MENKPRFSILLDLGLSPHEALIYEHLLTFGPQKASKIAEEVKLGRANVYSILAQLSKKGVILEIEGKQSRFQVTDPSSLQRLMDAKREATRVLETGFTESLRAIVSVYQLAIGKPAIQMFEGVAGFEKALDQSLHATTEILTYIDPEALRGELIEINARYVKRRVAKRVAKRIIMPHTPAAVAYAEHMTVPYTQILLVDHFPTSFHTAMELYDDVTTYLTLRSEKIISVIMRDADIAELQRAQFEYIWRSGVEGRGRLFDGRIGVGASGSITT